MENAVLRTSLRLGFHAGLCSCYPCDVPVRDLCHCHAVCWVPLYVFAMDIVWQGYSDPALCPGWGKTEQPDHLGRCSGTHDHVTLWTRAASSLLRPALVFAVSSWPRRRTRRLGSSPSSHQRFPRQWTSSQSRLHSQAYSLVSYTVAILTNTKSA